MHDRADLSRIGLKTGANDPAELPMYLYALTDECSPRREYEISAHALPDEMKVVVVSPHIGARPGDGVLPFLVIVDTGTGIINFPYIGLPLERAQRLLLGSGGSRRCDERR